MNCWYLLKQLTVPALYGNGDYKEDQKKRKQRGLYNGIIEDLFLHRALVHLVNICIKLVLSLLRIVPGFSLKISFV